MIQLRGKEMRRLSTIAISLLLSTGPSQAVSVVSDIFTGPSSFTVYGPIPSPINIDVFLFFDVSRPNELTPDDGYQIVGTVGTQHSIVEVCAQRSATGTRSCGVDGKPDFFTLTDADRHIYISISAEVYGNFIFNDASVSFVLPDNLSVAPPVPEPSTWAMLLIGFAALGFAGYRKSRRGNFMEPR
jgi:hypothetical protein